jgi:TolB-like protein/Tfp pilus assembly protein PilF
VLKPVLRRLSLCLLVAASLFPVAQAQTQQPGGHVVLVLPFDNRSGNPNLNWIGDSFPDTLNQRLTSAGFLTISRDDRTFALDHLGYPTDFRPTRATTIRIAQTLDAAYVIVGSFNIQNDRIQVQAQVLETNQLHLSAPLEDSAPLARLFDIENAIAWKVARQIQPRYNVAEQTFLSASAGIRLTAFENYIRGTGAPTSQERISRLQAALKDTPNYAEAELALGKEYYAARDFDQAAAVLAKVPQNDRIALEANFYLGLARFNSAKYAEAETAFAFVASRLPLPEVVNDQGVALARQNKDGAPLFLRASNADPNGADYHYNLAVSDYKRGDFAGANREVEQAIKLRPADPEAPQLRTLIAAGRAPAHTGFEPTTRLVRTYSEASFRQAAFELDQMRAMRLATLPPAQQAVEYTQLGREYLAQGLLPAAEQQFSAAISADSTSAPAHAGLAQVREQSGDPAAARVEAEAAIHRSPSFDAYMVLARIDLAANDLPNSARELSNALHIEPQNSLAQSLRQTLQARGQQVP